MKPIGTVLAALVVLLGQARSQTSFQKSVSCATDDVLVQLSYVDSVYEPGDTLTLVRQFSNRGTRTAYTFVPPDSVLRLKNCQAIVRWGGSWLVDLGRAHVTRLFSIPPGDTVLTTIKYAIPVDTSACATPWDLNVLANPNSKLVNVFFDVGVYITPSSGAIFIFDASGAAKFDSPTGEALFEVNLRRFVLGPIALRIAIE